MAVVLDPFSRTKEAGKQIKSSSSTTMPGWWDLTTLSRPQRRAAAWVHRPGPCARPPQRARPHGFVINDTLDSHLTHCLVVSSPRPYSLSQRQQCGLISSGPRVKGSPAPGSSWKLELKDSSLLVSPSCAKCICKQAFTVAPCSCSQGDKGERKPSKNQSSPQLASKNWARQSLAWKMLPGYGQSCAASPGPRA